MLTRIKILFVLCSFIGVSKLSAQTAKKAITIDQLLQLESISDFKISPDEKWVAYTLSENDLKKDKKRKRVYMISILGGAPIAISGKDYSASEPKWSPDNKYLSFLASKGEDEKTQVWLSNRLGGDAEVLTKIPQGVTSHEWSPSSDRLLLVLTDPKPEELTLDKEDDKKAKPYVIDRRQFKQDYVGYLDRYRNHLYSLVPGDSLATQLTFGDFDDSDPVWSPDGKKIAFVSNRTEDPDGNSDSNIWIVSADPKDKGAALIKVTTNPNSDNSPSWSPDGKNIVYKTITNGKILWYAGEKLAIAPAAGNGEAKVLTENLDRNISSPKFSKDGKNILFLLEENGTSILASIAPNGQHLQRIITGAISIAAYELGADAIVTLVGKVNRPNNLYIFKNKVLQELTTVNDLLLADTKKPTIEKITFNSTDGTPIEGFVVKPVDFDASKKYPTILWIHGGPTAQYDFSFDSEAQLFAANGYVVLLINPRGSTGYGEDFCKAIFADWGNLDYQDVMSGVDHAIAQGYADPNKLVVGGWSYGGILTNYVITKTNRFKAAMSGASEALYRANYGHDHYQLTWEQELGLPWENKEAWERISPYNDVAKIVTPTLWMGGSDDWNVPILNSEQMYMAMKRLGRETQLIVYPGEHHGISRPSFQKDRMERYLEWMKKYVK